MFPLYGNKRIIISLIFLLSGYCSFSQQNLPQFYYKNKLHFGFTVNTSYNMFQVHTSNQFLNLDTIKDVRMQPYYGFGLGGVADLCLGDQFNLLFTPNLSFVQRNLFYDFKEPKYNKKVEVESVYMDFPIAFKYRSERHWNVAFYVIAGVKFTYDFASDKDAPRSLSDPVVALKPGSFSYEFGCGMDLYFPYFKLSPELKFSQSFNNVLVKDNYVYTKALNSLFSRVFTLSFHFES